MTRDPREVERKNQDNQKPVKIPVLETLILFTFINLQFTIFMLRQICKLNDKWININGSSLVSKFPGLINTLDGYPKLILKKKVNKKKTKCQEQILNNFRNRLPLWSPQTQMESCYGSLYFYGA